MVEDSWTGNTTFQENPIQIVAKKCTRRFSNYKHTYADKD